MRCCCYFLGYSSPPLQTASCSRRFTRAMSMRVEAALKAGADPNTRDDLGSTALMHAGAYCSVECMKMLIAAGADVNAASNAGFTALMWSVSDAAKVKLLLGAHADVKARSKDGNTAVLLARQNAWPDSVPLLLAGGAIDEDGMQPGAGAILNDVARPVTAGTLDRGGTDAPGPSKRADVAAGAYLRRTRRARKGIAGRGHRPERSDPAKDHVGPPLTLAAHFGNIGQVQMLLVRGADPNARGTRGVTPLMAAAMAEHQDPAVIDLLLSKGAEIDAIDEVGRTALDWALFQGQTDTVKQLRAAGGHALAPVTHAPAPVDKPTLHATPARRPSPC